MHIHAYTYNRYKLFAQVNDPKKNYTPKSKAPNKYLHIRTYTYIYMQIHTYTYIYCHIHANTYQIHTMLIRPSHK
jgi:hypothetical protein